MLPVRRTLPHTHVNEISHLEPINSIPHETLLKIFRLLNAGSLFSVFSTCRTWNEILKNQLIFDTTINKNKNRWKATIIPFWKEGSEDKSFVIVTAAVVPRVYQSCKYVNQNVFLFERRHPQFAMGDKSILDLVVLDEDTEAGYNKPFSDFASYNQHHVGHQWPDERRYKRFDNLILFLSREFDFVVWSVSDRMKIASGKLERTSFVDMTICYNKFFLIISRDGINCTNLINQQSFLWGRPSDFFEIICIKEVGNNTVQISINNIWSQEQLLFQWDLEVNTTTSLPLEQKKERFLSPEGNSQIYLENEICNQWSDDYTHDYICEIGQRKFSFNIDKCSKGLGFTGNHFFYLSRNNIHVYDIYEKRSVADITVFYNSLEDPDLDLFKCECIEDKIFVTARVTGHIDGYERSWTEWFIFDSEKQAILEKSNYGYSNHHKHLICIKTDWKKINPNQRTLSNFYFLFNLQKNEPSLRSNYKNFRAVYNPQKNQFILGINSPEEKGFALGFWDLKEKKHTHLTYDPDQTILNMFTADKDIFVITSNKRKKTIYVINKENVEFYQVDLTSLCDTIDQIAVLRSRLLIRSGEELYLVDVYATKGECICNGCKKFKIKDDVLIVFNSEETVICKINFSQQEAETEEDENTDDSTEISSKENEPKT